MVDIPDSDFNNFYVILLIAIIAGLAGVGGGGLYVPALLFVFNFQFAICTQYSQFITFGSALAQTVLNWNKRNPGNYSKSVIYFQIVALFLPCQLGGNIIGSILSKILPTKITYSLAVVVLYIAIIRLSLKFYKLFTAELAKNNSRMQSGDSNPNPMLGSLVNNSATGDDRAPRSSSLHTNSLLPSLELPVPFILKTLGMYVVFYAISNSRFAFAPCTPGFDVLITLAYIPLAALVLHMYYSVDPEEIFDKLYIQITKDEFDGLFPIVAVLIFIVGIMCSLLGIGGGELLGPILIFLNVSPLISSATVPVFDLFSCLNNIGANAIQAIDAPVLNTSFCVLIFFMGFIGAFVGRYLGLYISNTYSRPSILLIFFLITLIAASAIYFYDFAHNNFTTTVAQFCPPS